MVAFDWHNGGREVLHEVRQLFDYVLVLSRPLFVRHGLKELKEISINSRRCTIKLEAGDAISQVYGAENIAEGLRVGFNVHLGIACNVAWSLRLTRTRSATAGGSERGGGSWLESWKAWSYAGQGWVHRMVRPIA